MRLRGFNYVSSSYLNNRRCFLAEYKRQTGHRLSFSAVRIRTYARRHRHQTPRRRKQRLRRRLNRQRSMGHRRSLRRHRRRLRPLNPLPLRPPRRHRVSKLRRLVWRSMNFINLPFFTARRRIVIQRTVITVLRCIPTSRTIPPRHQSRRHHTVMDQRQAATRPYRSWHVRAKSRKPARSTESSKRRRAFARSARTWVSSLCPIKFTDAQ